MRSGESRESYQARAVAKIAESYEDEGLLERPSDRGRWIKRGRFLSILQLVHTGWSRGPRTSFRMAVEEGVFAGRRDNWIAGPWRLTFDRKRNGGWITPR